MTLENAIKLVNGAKVASHLFGDDPKKRYHELALLLHPDRVKGNPKAALAFAKLSSMYAELTAPAPATVIGKWRIDSVCATGEICDLYYTMDASERAVFKIVRNESDNDLVENEWAHLRMLHGDKHTDNFKKYLPRPIEALEASGRRANVLSLAKDALSLTDILSITAYPNGLPFRHIVWMANRAFSALSFVHSCGIVHGAVLPEHLMFGPVNHGFALVDWCYSVTGESKAHIPAIVKDREQHYPSEVKKKKPATPATDIYMLASVLMESAQEIPRRFKSLFEWCMASSPHSRPGDAWKVRDRLLDLAREQYGEPSYVKLEIPVS